MHYQTISSRIIICSLIMFFQIMIVPACCRNIKSESTSIPEGNNEDIKKSSTTAETLEQFNATLKRSNTVTDEQSKLLLAKDAYCTCKCCRPGRKGEEVCKSLVQHDLSSEFECPNTFCSKAVSSDCSKWNTRRCNKVCFCQKCKGRLPTGDERCSSELESAAGCHCNDNENTGNNNSCNRSTQGLASVWHFLKAAKMNKKFIKCQMGCFCNSCDHTILSRVFKGINIAVMCQAYPSIPDHCPKPCPPCPNYAAANQAKETLKDLWTLQGSLGG